MKIPFILAALLTGSSALSGEAAAAQPPNIIYILTDDLGYGDLSCYGQDKFTTPNIDRLAAEGMRFTDHYSGSTVCAPSRCVLMTGLHTGHAQVRGNREVQPEGQAPMARGTVTIPTLLRKAGYVSGIFGKWGLGAPGSAGDPMEFFDTFYGYNCQRAAHNYYPDHLWHDRERIELDGRTYAHDLIMNAAFDFIRANTNRPFFCYLPVTIPHAAMQAPPELHAKYRKQFPQFEQTIGTYYAGGSITNPVAAFPAMMETLDNSVGELLTLLDELGIADRTVVLFTSDNGAHLEGGHDPDFWDSNGPLRGHKRDLYEGGIRAPFIVRWPGTVEAGTTSAHASAFWDMLPTFCEMAGADIPAGTDGISILPELTGRKQQPHAYLYWEFPAFGGAQAVRRGNFKAVRRNVGSNPDAAIELYDLSTDISESTDVAAEHPELTGDMRLIMEQAHTPSKTFPLFPDEMQTRE